MCSVIGYVGKRLSSELVLEGLKRLEYRGYDSAGFACVEQRDNSLAVVKSVGQIHLLKQLIFQKKIDGHTGIGHTRWATHGQATECNAHPHVDCSRRIAVVHNGVIENFQELKVSLEQEGHVFTSDTDTEVIAHLFEKIVLQQTQEYQKSFFELVGQLQGAYAFVVVALDYPDTLFIARKGSPLCIGIGVDEMFVASDPLAFAQEVKKVAFVPENSCGTVTRDGFVLYNQEGQKITVEHTLLDMQWIAAEKGEHEHFMLKEIYEQKQAITNSVHFYQSLFSRVEETLGITKDFLQGIERVYFVACGTSWHAGCIAEFFFEEITGIPATALLASEFRYRTFFPEKNALYIAISQSGETADVLEAIRLINTHSLSTVALTNVSTSSLVRECRGFWLTQAGPEIAVASTKAFSTQLTALYWLAHYTALVKGRINHAQMIKAEQELFKAADLLEETLERYKLEMLTEDGPIYSEFSKYIFLGRHISYPFALEAALKLKEIAYVFAQAYPAGELKHGPLALVEETVPVVVFSHDDPVIYQKLLTNVQEVKARNGQVIAFALEGQFELMASADRSFVVPRVTPLLTPLVMAGLMQFFCYAIAYACGRAIDKPRNLAKSVTVE